MGGFVSTVVDKVKDIGRGVKNVVSNIIGNPTGPGGILTGIGQWIMEKIFGVGDTPSYKPEEASVDQTKKINELLNNCIESYGEQAKGYENTAKLILKAYLEEIEETLKPFKNDNIIPEYVFKSLHQETKFLTKILDNLYYSGITRAFSLSNNKLLSILELEAGKEKENKLQRMAIETLEDTHVIFVDKIKVFLGEQQELIVKELKELKENHIEEGQNIEKSFLDIQEKAKDNLDMTETIDKLTIVYNKLEKIAL